MTTTINKSVVASMTSTVAPVQIDDTFVLKAGTAPDLFVRATLRMAVLIKAFSSAWGYEALSDGCRLPHFD
jgi:hypothetical protein